MRMSASQERHVLFLVQSISCTALQCYKWIFHGKPVNSSQHLIKCPLGVSRWTLWSCQRPSHMLSTVSTVCAHIPGDCCYLHIVGEEHRTGGGTQTHLQIQLLTAMPCHHYLSCPLKQTNTINNSSESTKCCVVAATPASSCCPGETRHFILF